MHGAPYFLGAVVVLVMGAMAAVALAQGPATTNAEIRDGKRLFEGETFGGNGRTCRTCHGKDTGTVSPRDAQKRFQRDPGDILFIHDGSDDGNGNGATRMLTDATILVTIPLPPNVILNDDPAATFVVLTRGIPTTLNTPALDTVFMLDGRQPSLESQAAAAIHDHAEALVSPTGAQLQHIAKFERTAEFFSSPATEHFAGGGPAPDLPKGHTASEKRGRRFFEDVLIREDAKHGFCASCHSGPMLNRTNAFLESVGGPPAGTKFQSALISQLNEAGNPTRTFVFNPGPGETIIESPDPGRALITGIVDDVNVFKIPQLRGISRTAPYFHDNSAKTLENVLAHYSIVFQIFTGGTLTAQDQKDIIAFLKLLD